MANMTADVQRPVRLPPGGLEMRKVKLAGYTNYAAGNTAFTVYKGAVVYSDVSDTDGYASPKQSGINAVATDVFLGVAAERKPVTSSNLADGSVEMTVFTNGVWAFPKGALAQTDLGATAMAADDGTIVSATQNNVAIGKIVEVDDTYVWVDISDYSFKVSAETT